MKGRRGPLRGMTLIEMMVAIVIFMIFVGAIYGVYHVARVGAEDTQKRQDVYQTARALLAQINTELCCIYQPASVSTSTITGTKSDASLEQQSDTLTLLTTGHVPSAKDAIAGDVCQVTYRMERDDDGHPLGLVMEEELHPGLAMADTQPDPVMLSNEVIGFNCKFLAQSADDWQDEWTSDETSLPAAVRVELIIQSKEKNAKPITVAATANLSISGNSPTPPTGSTSGTGTTPTLPTTPAGTGTPPAGGGGAGGG